MKVAVVIPARLGSKRFPRKVLARDTGKYLVQHVHERVAGCPGIDRVLIATDSREVLDACRSFGAEAVMTSAEHVSGTDRVAEVARGLDHEVVVNVQGDEPLLEHDDLRLLVDLFAPGVVMTTLAARRTDPEGFADPNIVKAVVASGGNALYFTRAPAPHSAPGGPVEWLQHIGVYGFRRDFLLRFSSLPPSPLEKRERLEQLRVLEGGHAIRVGVTPHRHLGIDTEEEYRRFVQEYLRSRGGRE
ncbi:MAG: 3-deoxy-manno-octulosonate cytidylyltransferase [Planctomycetes bacterium]|nr:3-deoxy-manno-octulosonate cytidylyltransferase [Planctomycetota bacterium]